MIAAPIISGATSLEHLKTLLPLAYQHRDIDVDEFFSGFRSFAPKEKYVCENLDKVFGVDVEEIAFSDDGFLADANHL